MDFMTTLGDEEKCVSVPSDGTLRVLREVVAEAWGLGEGTFSLRAQGGAEVPAEDDILLCNIDLADSLEVFLCPALAARLRLEQEHGITSYLQAKLITLARSDGAHTTDGTITDPLRFEQLELLLAATADGPMLDPFGNHALGIAAGFNAADTVAYLCRSGAVLDAPDACGYTAAHTAARHGRKEALEVLIEMGASLSMYDSSHMTPLHLAAGNGWEECVGLMLGVPVTTDPVDGGGRSALLLASLKGKEACVTRLLSHGADVTATDAGGATALHLAVLAGMLGTVQCLLAGGAQCNVQNGDGATPLYTAAARGEEDITRALLDAGADPNISCCEGNTALMVSAMNMHVPTCRLLVSVSDLKAVNDNGYTTAEVGAFSGSDEVRSLVEAAVKK